MTSVKRPASQYYWGNWLADTALQSCSLAARGLWHEMNCHMHQSEPYGHLYVNGRAVSAEKLANLCRISANTCRKLLAELEDAGVFSRDENSAIFSRRMVRDEVARERAAEAGRSNGNKGADYGHLGAEHGAKGGRPKKVEGGVISDEKNTPPEPPYNPPSSTASASSTAVLQRPVVNAVALIEPQPTAKRSARQCPESFLVDGPLQKWAREKVPGLDIRYETEKFRDHTFSTARTNWAATWRAWMRKAFEDRGKRNGSTEPAWRTERRERIQSAAPFAAARPVASAADFFDDETPALPNGISET